MSWPLPARQQSLASCVCGLTRAQNVAGLRTWPKSQPHVSYRNSLHPQMMPSWDSQGRVLVLLVHPGALHRFNFS